MFTFRYISWCNLAVNYCLSYAFYARSESLNLPEKVVYGGLSIEEYSQFYELELFSLLDVSKVFTWSFILSS